MAARTAAAAIGARGRALDLRAALVCRGLDYWRLGVESQWMERNGC
jgi:hypothetical protein